MAPILAPFQQTTIIVTGYTDNVPIGPKLQQQGIGSNQQGLVRITASGEPNRRPRFPRLRPMATITHETHEWYGRDEDGGWSGRAVRVG
jgi:hypothetical protein